MLIEANDLTKKFGKKLALDKVNLKIDQGQLVAYLGTNGAGKSTTINMLTGLSKPTSGMIKYAKNLKIGVVFQNSVLDKNLTVKDNLYFRGRMYHDFSKQWLEQLVELIGIKNILHKKINSLSGGQKRRVDIARGLINRPNLLFLDEPTTGLDIQTRLAIWNLLQKLQKKQGLTIFLTTHYLEEAENADKMYILKNGKILAEGSAKQIKAKYAPAKLLIKVKENSEIRVSKQVKQLLANELEIDALSKDEVIKLLNENQSKIQDFEYRKGSLNDAFIKITGKELE